MKVCIRFFVALTILFCFGLSSLQAGNCDIPGDVDQDRDFSYNGIDYSIKYSTESGSSNRISTSDAADLQDMAENSYDDYIGGLNFAEPYLSTFPDYTIIAKDDWHYAEPSCVAIHAPDVREKSLLQIRQVFAHEYFHTIQRRYKEDAFGNGNSGYIGSTFGKWVSEGSDEGILDMANADYDNTTGWPSYESQAVSALNSPEASFFDREYNGALFWKYIYEQMKRDNDPAASTTPVSYGSEFMVDFYDRLVVNGNSGSSASKVALEEVMATYSSRSLERVYLNHSVANYTREFDVSGIANNTRYFYIDETTTGANAYSDTVNREMVSNFFPLSDTGVNVKAYAAKYFEVVVGDPNSSPCQVFGMKASSDKHMGFALIAVDFDGRVVAVREGRGTEFGASVFNSETSPVSRICGILVGLEQDVTADIDLDAGFVQTFDVIRPTFSYKAYPGTFDDPGNVLVRVFVDGPPALKPVGVGNLSILGLLREDFEVRINNVVSNILTADYVGGEYWLLVQAPGFPDIPANGSYDLEVELCEGSNGVQLSSVEYAEIQINHVVALDISGSMENPTSAKLDAAKEAAKFYIDAIRDDDQFTLVTFTGDAVECNDIGDDVFNEAGSSGTILVADSTSRGDMKSKVNSLSSLNLTSIGDGLWESRNALGSAALPPAGVIQINRVQLLTDGIENEARFWDLNTCNGATTVQEDITGDGIIVNTIAFGDGSDQALLQQIAGATGGDYSYVDVDFFSGLAVSTPPGGNPFLKMASGGSFAASATASASSLVTLQNALTQKYLMGAEKTRGLQRLCFEVGTIASGDSISVPLDLTEGDVENAIIYVGWSDPSNSLGVDVFDPSSTDIAVFSDKRLDNAHVIYVIDPGVMLAKGQYDFQLQSPFANTVEYFVGISGIPGSGLETQLTLSQIRLGGGNNELESQYERFEKCLPVDIRTTLVDNLGPVLDAVVDMTVILPDGTEVCGPLQLLDDGGSYDGPADDGIYGHRFRRTLQASPRPLNNQIDPAGGIPGTYRVTVTAVGKGNDGTEFNRTLEASFQVYERRDGPLDRDGDGLPDQYEKLYNFINGVDDSVLDPDEDGLTTGLEHKLGTHPLDPDTDGGGESDGSEVESNLCPLQPDDDRLPAPTDVSIITTSDVDAHGGGSNLIPDNLLLQFPDHISYTQMEIYRSTNPSNVTSNLVGVIDLDGVVTNSVHDGPLVDGKTYYYKMRARGLGGAATPFSRLLSAVAKSDPVAPTGNIIINCNAPYTSSTQVQIRLSYTVDAVEFRLSNDVVPTGLFSPIPANDVVAPYNLPGTLMNGDLGKIFVQYRDANGNVSVPTSTTILYRTDLDFDNDGVLDLADVDDDNDGIEDSDEIKSTFTNPLNADSDGDGFGDKCEIILGSDAKDALSLPALDPAKIFIGPTDVDIVFPTKPGIEYQVEASPTPFGPWTPVGPVIFGDGNDQGISEPWAPYSVRFFRYVTVNCP